MLCSSPSACIVIACHRRWGRRAGAQRRQHRCRHFGRRRQRGGMAARGARRAALRRRAGGRQQGRQCGWPARRRLAAALSHGKQQTVQDRSAGSGAGGGSGCAGRRRAGGGRAVASPPPGVVVLGLSLPPWWHGEGRGRSGGWQGKMLDSEARKLPAAACCTLQPAHRQGSDGRQLLVPLEQSSACSRWGRGRVVVGGQLQQALGPACRHCSASRWPCRAGAASPGRPQGGRGGSIVSGSLAAGCDELERGTGGPGDAGGS